MEERVQKIIAAHGIMSRRAAEKLIEEGRVKVNGNIVELGAKADEDKDEITVDGEIIRPKDPVVCIMLNKPKGYVTTMNDEFSRRTVSDLVSDAGVRVYPVGRLDMDSEGLLLLTNDGKLANRLMHPSFEKVKKYEVRVRGDIENIPMLSGSMTIDGYTISPAEVEVLKKDRSEALLLIGIHEGRNRQIRKMCENAGLAVISLKRISIGRLTLGGLGEGKWRRLTDEEIELLER